MQSILITLIPTSKFLVAFILHIQHCCTCSQQNIVSIALSHVVNPATLDDEFNKLIDYIEYKLLKWDNTKLEAQWWEEHEKRIFKHVDNKMRDFDGVVTSEVERRKWGWHPFFDIFTTIPSTKTKVAPIHQMISLDFEWIH